MITQERIILCGTNGTGKSTFSNKLIEASLKARDNKKALAVLPDDSEPIFHPYTELNRQTLKTISQRKEKTFKIYFDNSKLFEDILINFKDGTLVLDDARFYTGSNDEILKKLFIRSRQNNIHILFICHGLSEIPPNLFTFGTKLVLFNTVDSWIRLKNKIPNPKKFELIVNDVRNRANNHKSNCNYLKRQKCNCGASYIYKVVDLKRDLL